MTQFKGFTAQETFTRVPDVFFRHLMNEIEDVAELKVTLYFLWRIEHMENGLHALRRSDIEADKTFMAGISVSSLKDGLEKAVERGSLLVIENEAGDLFFLNSPRGRASAEALKNDPGRATSYSPSMPPPERPNVFKLYEENIGPLTPIIADALKDAEETYTEEWVKDAIEIAVKNNKRNWKYTEAILKRWKEEGRAQKQGKRDDQEDGRRYIEGKYAEFIEH